MSYQLTRKKQLQQLVVHSLELKSKSSTSPAPPQKNPVTQLHIYVDGFLGLLCGLLEIVVTLRT